MQELSVIRAGPLSITRGNFRVGLVFRFHEHSTKFRREVYQATVLIERLIFYLEQR